MHQRNQYCKGEEVSWYQCIHCPVSSLDIWMYNLVWVVIFNDGFVLSCKQVLRCGNQPQLGIGAFCLVWDHKTGDNLFSMVWRWPFHVSMAKLPPILALWTLWMLPMVQNNISDYPSHFIGKVCISWDIYGYHDFYTNSDFHSHMQFLQSSFALISAMIVISSILSSQQSLPAVSLA